MFDKAIDNFLTALKFIPDWLFMSKMIKKLHGTLFADYYILFFDEDTGSFIFLMMKWVY